MGERYLLNPDCAGGKHLLCDGGWDADRDEPCECPCACHDAGGAMDELHIGPQARVARRSHAYRLPAAMALMLRQVGSIVLYKGYYWTVTLERYGSNGGLVKCWQLSTKSELRAAGIPVD